MGQITVCVNNRNYVVACEDGQEDHVQSLANYLHRQAQEMSQTVGQVGEGRLLLLSALVVADELSGVLKDMDALKARLAKAEATETKVEETLACLTERVKQLTTQLERS